MALNDVNLAPFMDSPAQTGIRNAIALGDALANINRSNAAVQAQTLANQYAPQLNQAKLAEAQAALQGQQIRNQYLPQTLQSAANLQGAQAKIDQMKASDPNLFAASTLTGPAAQAVSMEYLKTINPEAYKNAQSIQHAKEALGHARMIQTAGSNQRNYMLSLAEGMGYDPTQAQKELFENGKTLSQLADEKGLNLKDVKPFFPATTATQTTIQKQSQAGSGLDTLNDFTSQAIKPYGGAWDVLTRPWFFDAHSSDADKQEQAAKYYAAHVLAAENAGLRMRQQNATGGIGAMEALIPTVVGSVKTDTAYLPGKVQARVQDLVSEQLNKMLRAEQAQSASQSPGISAPYVPPSESGENATVLVRDSKGQLGRIPASQLEEALKEGYSRG